MKFPILFLMLVVVLAACAPSTPGPVNQAPAKQTPAPATEIPPTLTPYENQIPVPQAVLAAQQDLSQRLGVAIDAIQINEITEVDWSNGCLDLAEPGEMCTEAIVPGFRAVFTADGKTYEYRTDREGTLIRAANGGEQAGEPTPQPVNDANLPGAVLSARQVLAQQLGVALNEIEVLSVEQVEWPNSCLGVNEPGKMCAMVITPGYRVIFQVDGKRYEYHTDEEGGAVVVARAPLPRMDQKVIVWEQTENGVCSRAEISQEQVAFGPCGGTMMVGNLQPERLQELQQLVSTYGSFIAGTKAGTLEFNGEGQQTATEAEQRSIAEWARLVFQEAQAGRSGASWGLVFAWHQEGGIAGLCSDVTLYTTGWYYATSCKGGQPRDLGHFRLNPEQLAQVYNWVAQYAGFEYEFQDPATADAMSTRLVFSGAGQTQPTLEQQQAIVNLAAQLYATAKQ